MTVQKVKGLLQRMYRVNSSDQRLSYVHVDKQVSTHAPDHELGSLMLRVARACC